ncbi:hypothetical protein [Rhizobacter sp. SG703]|uniref:hypothetical protein n=1 Tax=Rhizobacter sp. SG703 TaxID=2587140 RepID=UPI001447FBB2|nr:hypothetical protein [Rhizobacter sp. SG703]NKI94871.1 hypothetical protein [Rhizobacter sp. SG703]
MTSIKGSDRERDEAGDPESLRRRGARVAIEARAPADATVLRGAGLLPEAATDDGSIHFSSSMNMTTVCTWASCSRSSGSKPTATSQCASLVVVNCTTAPLARSRCW